MHVGTTALHSRPLTDNQIDQTPHRLNSTACVKRVEGNNQVVCSTWDLEIEYAMQAKHVEKLWDTVENVLVSFTSSQELSQPSVICGTSLHTEFTTSPISSR